MIPAPVGPRLPAARHARPRRVYRGRRIAAWAALAGTGAVALGVGCCMRGWMAASPLPVWTRPSVPTLALVAATARSAFCCSVRNRAQGGTWGQDDGGARSGTAMLVHLVQGWEGRPWLPSQARPWSSDPAVSAQRRGHADR